MSTNQCDIGLIGLAVMGENLVLNMESKGFSGRRFQSHHRSDREICCRPRQGKKHSADAHDGRIRRRAQASAQSDDHGEGRRAGRCRHRSARAAARKRRRHHRRRQFAFHRHATPLQGSWKEKAFILSACGVSGGEEGALKGPSLMPGGPRESWEIIAPIFRKIAAQVDGEPCCRYMGPGRRRPLRQDGAQRHRVRRHAVDLRSLRNS